MSNSGIKLEHQEAATNSWADGAWTRTVIEMNGGTTADEVVGQARTPTLKITDEAGDAKFVVDHQGLQVKEYYELYEDWTRPTAALLITLTTGTVKRDGNEGADTVTAHAQMTADPAGGSAIREVNFPIRILNMGNSPIGIVAMCEWQLSMSDITTNNDMDVRVGFRGDGSIFTDEHLAFEKLETDTNWFAIVGDSGVTDLRVDTTIAPTVDVKQKFRIECYLSTTSVGASIRGLFYINGILRANIDIPANSPAFGDFESTWGMATRAISTAGNTVELGPVHLVANYVEDVYGLNDA